MPKEAHIRSCPVAGCEFKTRPQKSEWRADAMLEHHRRSKHEAPVKLTCPKCPWTVEKPDVLARSLMGRHTTKYHSGQANGGKSVTRPKPKTVNNAAILIECETHLADVLLHKAQVDLDLVADVGNALPEAFVVLDLDTQQDLLTGLFKLVLKENGAADERLVKVLKNWLFTVRKHLDAIPLT